MKKKALLIVLAAALVVVASIGGTLAWLTDKTSTVENTFTVGNIDLDLFEHPLATDGTSILPSASPVLTNTYHLMPGVTYQKDPTLVVKGNSEDCWLFFKVEAASSLAGKLTYTLNLTGWTELTTGSGVYYREYAKQSNDLTLNLLTNNQISVASSVTGAQLTAIGSGDALKFTGYAIQKAQATTAADAWTYAASLS